MVVGSCWCWADFFLLKLEFQTHLRPKCLVSFVLSASQPPCCEYFVHPYEKVRWLLSTRTNLYNNNNNKNNNKKQKKRENRKGRGGAPSGRVRVQVLGGASKSAAVSPSPTGGPRCAFPNPSRAPPCLSRRRWRGGWRWVGDGQGPGWGTRSRWGCRSSASRSDVPWDMKPPHLIDAETDTTEWCQLSQKGSDFWLQSDNTWKTLTLWVTATVTRPGSTHTEGQRWWGLWVSRASC